MAANIQYDILADTTFIRTIRPLMGLPYPALADLVAAGPPLTLPTSSPWRKVSSTDAVDESALESDDHAYEVASSAVTRRKILVVEDEGIVALDVMSTLRQMGYLVVGHALSGEEAIQDAARTHPDLVLMDIRLKGIVDGIEAARQIRASFSGIHIVFLTAFADEDTIRRITATGLGKYLRKPYSRSELEAAIEHEL